MAESEQSQVVVPKKHPSGADILRLLVKLLAEQEGVTIDYTIETKEELAV